MIETWRRRDGHARRVPSVAILASHSFAKISAGIFFEGSR